MLGTEAGWRELRCSRANGAPPFLSPSSHSLATSNCGTQQQQRSSSIGNTPAQASKRPLVRQRRPRTLIARALLAAERAEALQGLLGGGEEARQLVQAHHLLRPAQQVGDYAAAQGDITAPRGEEGRGGRARGSGSRRREGSTAAGLGFRQGRATPLPPARRAGLCSRAGAKCSSPTWPPPGARRRSAPQSRSEYRRCSRPAPGGRSEAGSPAHCLAQRHGRHACGLAKPLALNTQPRRRSGRVAAPAGNSRG